MSILEDQQKDQLRELFQSLDKDVKISIFTSEKDCEQCKTTLDLIEEIGGLSEKISVAVMDITAQADEAGRLGVDKTPAIALMGDEDYGIRFYGVPAGYEFTPLIQDIINISRRDPGLSEEVAAELEKIDQPVHIQVMTTPT